MHGLLQGKCKIQHSGTQLIRTPNRHAKVSVLRGFSKQSIQFQFKTNRTMFNVLRLSSSSRNSTFIQIVGNSYRAQITSVRKALNECVLLGSQESVCCPY